MLISNFRPIRNVFPVNSNISPLEQKIVTPNHIPQETKNILAEVRTPAGVRKMFDDKAFAARLQIEMKNASLKTVDLFKDEEVAKLIIQETQQRIVKKLVSESLSPNDFKSYQQVQGQLQNVLKLYQPQPIELLRKAQNQELKFQAKPSYITKRAPNQEEVRFTLDTATGKYYRYSDFSQTQKEILVNENPNASSKVFTINCSYVSNKIDRRAGALAIITAASAVAAGAAGTLSQTVLGDEAVLTAITAGTVMSLMGASYRHPIEKGALMSTIPILAGKLIGLRAATALVKWIPGIGNGANAISAGAFHSMVGLSFMGMFEHQINKYGGTYLDSNLEAVSAVAAAIISIDTFLNLEQYLRPGGFDALLDKVQAHQIFSPPVAHGVTYTSYGR